MPTTPKPPSTKAQTAHLLRAQFARNAASLQTMLTKAERTGRKVGGYTADQLRPKVAEFQRWSTADDAAILAHVGRVPPYSVRKQLREATLAVGRPSARRAFPADWNKRTRTRYLLDGIPAKAWRAARAKASREGRSIRNVLLTAITAYAAEGEI